MIPEGWLINPNKKCLLRFQNDPMCLKKLPEVYMDNWSVRQFEHRLVLLIAGK